MIDTRPTLEAVARRPENQVCADCGSAGPRWASINLGVFICIECSGAHRGMGTHVSKVRSVNLDQWDNQSIALLAAVGNAVSNQYYEATLPSHFVRPSAIMNSDLLGKFICDKYIRKQWAPKGVPKGPAEVHLTKAIDSQKRSVAESSSAHVQQSREKLAPVVERQVANSNKSSGSDAFIKSAHSDKQSSGKVRSETNLLDDFWSSPSSAPVLPNERMCIRAEEPSDSGAKATTPNHLTPILTEKTLRESKLLAAREATAELLKDGVSLGFAEPTWNEEERSAQGTMHQELHEGIEGPPRLGCGSTCSKDGIPIVASKISQAAALPPLLAAIERNLQTLSASSRRK